MDYTIMRSNPKKGIIVCPSCGRKGKVSWYDEPDDNKSTLIIHATESSTMGFANVTDSCWVKRSVVRSKYPVQCDAWDKYHNDRKLKKAKRKK